MAPNVQSLGSNIDKVLICDVHNGWGKCEWCEWFKHLGLIVNQKKKTTCIRDIKSELSKKGHTTGVIFFFQNATYWCYHKRTFFYSMLRNEQCYSWQIISFQYRFVQVSHRTTRWRCVCVHVVWLAQPQYMDSVFAVVVGTNGLWRSKNYAHILLISQCFFIWIVFFLNNCMRDCMSVWVFFLLAFISICFEWFKLDENWVYTFNSHLQVLNELN